MNKSQGSEHEISIKQYPNLPKFNPVEDEKPRFESVIRRRTIRYYVGGISLDSNRAGLIKFLDEHGVKAVGVRIIETRRNSLAAKITVYTADRHIIESDIWPRKMYCRRWYGKEQWNAKFDYHKAWQYEEDSQSVD